MLRKRGETKSTDSKVKVINCGEILQWKITWPGSAGSDNFLVTSTNSSHRHTLVKFMANSNGNYLLLL